MGDEFPAVEGVEHRFVEANGVRLHVAEAGDPQAPPLLLLHGWPQHWWMWRRAIAALRGERRLIVPDLRGFGWSDTPPGGYDVETFASDNLALLDVLGIERLPVAGHDWGGITAFLMALRSPERVERLLALNVPHPWVRARPRAMLGVWRTWYAALVASPLVGRRAVRHGFPWVILSRGNAGEPFGAEDRRVYGDRLAQPERARASVALYRNYPRFSIAVAAGRYRPLRLTVPGRIVFGARDRYVPRAYLDGHEPYADDLTVELVEDSGHFIVDERPDLVIERLRWVCGAAG